MFKFDWDKLGRSDEQRCESWLNSYFSRVALPESIGGVSVSGLSFGSQPPRVSVLDIAPLPAAVREALRDYRIQQRHRQDEDEDEDEEDAERVVEDEDSGSSADGSLVGEDDAGDMMISVRLAYESDARFAVHTELVVNFPTPGFARLPITLRVTQLSFEGIMLLIRSRGKMYLSFRNDDPVGPLKDVNIESEIGDMSKPVLKNTQKVEQFIIAQLQRVMQQRMVFPQFVSAGKKKDSNNNKQSSNKKRRRKRINNASSNTNTHNNGNNNNNNNNNTDGVSPPSSSPASVVHHRHTHRKQPKRLSSSPPPSHIASSTAAAAATVSSSSARMRYQPHTTHSHSQYHAQLQQQMLNHQQYQRYLREQERKAVSASPMLAVGVPSGGFDAPSIKSARSSSRGKRGSSKSKRKKKKRLVTPRGTTSS